MIGALGSGVQGAATLNLGIKHPLLNSSSPVPDPRDLPGFVRYLSDVFWLKSQESWLC